MSGIHQKSFRVGWADIAFFVVLVLTWALVVWVTGARGWKSLGVLVVFALVYQAHGTWSGRRALRRELDNCRGCAADRKAAS